MQSNQPVSFFAPYPLKAIPEENSSDRKPNLTPYLQALLAGQSRSASKARSFPMVNPYPNGIPGSTGEAKLHRQPWKEKPLQND